MEQTPKIVLIGTTIYFFIGVMICDSLKNTRDGEEQGSSRWATIQEINRKYAAKEIVFPGVPKEMQNMILTSKQDLDLIFTGMEKRKYNYLRWTRYVEIKRLYYT